MTDPEPSELRELREERERQAWLERALTRLESGSKGEQDFAAYMRVQIAEDEAAEAAYLDYLNDQDGDQPLRRATKARDRSGLELAMMLLLGKLDEV